MSLPHVAPVTAADTGSSTDPRPVPKIRDLDTPREFPPISSLKEWQARAREIRQQALVSCGLWPMPQKAPLNPHVFGRIERGDYSIEKVYFETWPGFFLAGNLYRPLGKGKGPFPAILNPHGHWSNGRMADEKDGSIAARCISFARQAMIAFSYDMVGYNDTQFASSTSGKTPYNTHRQFATNQTDLLWNISLMGLQTWNSIRALDFLQSLPDADHHRLACTGESGGGTQTFMLGAVDDRLALQAPIVMVSHSMQGGCLCENAPGLRVQFSNMEIAATPAPRPQMLVAATGDWTKDTLTVEGPAIGHIYELFGARKNFYYTRFDFGHNYNQTSREAVYGWFGKWLLHQPDFAPIKEPPYKKEPDSALRVFPDGQLPAGALTESQFIESLKRVHQNQWQELVPQDKAGLSHFREVMLPAWRHTLQLESPARGLEVNSDPLQTIDSFSTAALQIRRHGEPSTIRARYWAPPSILQQHSPQLVVLANPDASTINSQPSTPSRLLQRGLAVLLIEQFSTIEPADQFSNFYCTYNRTQIQNRVRDLLAVCAAANSIDPRKHGSFRVTLAGNGKAGLWVLMAAPGADAVAADCSALDMTDEHALLAPELFCPGILALGGFQTAAMLAAPHSLLLHNTGRRFSTDAVVTTYAAAKASGKLRSDNGCLSDADVADWISALK